MTFNTFLFVLLLLSPIGLFVVFWAYANKRGWQSIQLFSISITISLAILVFVLWLGVREDWLLRLGLSAAVVNGIGIFIWAKTSPESVAKLGLAKEETKHSSSSFSLIPAREFAIFVFIVAGYWGIVFLFEPATFASDFYTQLWIIPVAFTITAIEFLLRWLSWRKNHNK